MTTLRLFAVAVFLLAITHNAHATDDFEVAANTCTPTSTTVGNAGYIMSTSVRHDSGATGTIEFYCMLPRDVTTIYAVAAVAENLSGTTYRVKVHIKRISKTGGNLGTIVTMDSANGVLYQAVMPSEHTVDYANYYYFIEYEVYRLNTNAEPKIYGITIDSDHT